MAISNISNNKVSQTDLNNYFNATAALLKQVHGKVSLKLFRKLTKEVSDLVCKKQLNAAEFITFNQYSISVDT